MKQRKNNKFRNKITGKKGELMAAKFLINKGYRIITTNYTKKIGEIDIIAYKNKVFNFIEVKSVIRETTFNDSYSQNSYFLPEELVNYEKMLHMKRVIEIFLYENKIYNSALQISVITVTFYRSGEIPRINFIENVGY